MAERTPLKAHDLDIIGECFGIVIDPPLKNPEWAKLPNPYRHIKLYIEDDENWHYKTSFSEFWLKDLQRVCKKARQEIVQRIADDEDSGVGQ